MKPKQYTYSDISELNKQHSELFIDDNIGLALDELFDIEFPGKKDNKTQEEVEVFALSMTDGNHNTWGVWVYYPWLNRVVHFPPVDKLRALRTSRNRNLITAEEQAKLYAASIAVIGMSVGSNVVEALVSQGIGGNLYLIDMDIIEPSNLNRIRSPYHQVGIDKVEAISRRVWEIDPYIEIHAYNDGLNEINLADIAGKVQILVDEMDDLKMKILLRETAKVKRLPVLMAADDGDDVLLDIERYDLNPDMQIFDGRVPEEIMQRIKTEKIPRAELGAMIGTFFVGIGNIPLRMFRSLAEVGKTLPSWPQLGGAAALSGIAIAYSVRKVILGEGLQEGRTLVSLDEKLDKEHKKPEYQAELAKFRALFSGK
jgi:molybdopterin/thiamine biosynthesis adenylyltransferase